jgi:hypothetical protein
MNEGREGWADDGVPLCEEAEVHLRQADDPEALARQLNNIGCVLQASGDLINALAKVEEGVELARARNDIWLLPNILESLGSIEFNIGHVAAAEAHWKEGLELAGAMQNRVKATMVLIGLARLAQLNEQPLRCLTLMGAAAGVQKRLGKVLDWAIHRDVITKARASAESVIGREAADAAWLKGAQMSLAEAVRYGIDCLAIT